MNDRNEGVTARVFPAWALEHLIALESMARGCVGALRVVADAGDDGDACWLMHGGEAARLFTVDDVLSGEAALWLQAVHKYEARA